jgi:catechol 2,3-dioxygenase-like lactoylglutathione lyase family enzyme
MPVPNQVILYVSDPGKSAAFYAGILDQKPQVLSPNFVVFDLGHGFTLGLLARAKVEPAAAPGVSSELCFIVDTKEALEALHRQWVQQGVSIALAPQLMYFGGTNFMGLDPDGHRLRVSTPDKA